MNFGTPAFGPHTGGLGDTRQGLVRYPTERAAVGGHSLEAC